LLEEEKGDLRKICCEWGWRENLFSFGDEEKGKESSEGAWKNLWVCAENKGEDVLSTNGGRNW